MALSAAFTRVIVVVALLAAFTHQMSAVDGKHQVEPPSLDPPEVNLYPPSSPYTATIQAASNLTDEVCNVLIEHDGSVPAWEGMAYQVGMPDAEPNRFSYFMLAATRYGDHFDGKTASFCVRRVGGTSNYLCDAQPGSKVELAGPSLTNMLLPQDNPVATQIIVACDTGIAPFRGYLRRMFVEDVPFKFDGQARLLFGASDADSIFYDEELSKYAEEHPENFAYEKATGGVYGIGAVHSLVEKSISGIYDQLKSDHAYISFCGHNAMMPMIYYFFEREAASRGDDWNVILARLLKTKQWREITYRYGSSSSKGLVEEMMPEILNILGRKAATMKLPQREAKIYGYEESESLFFVV